MRCISFVDSFEKWRNKNEFFFFNASLTLEYLAVTSPIFFAGLLS
jgi:putative SOS response-associated peptidase YedK